jgi:hypothetical protein
MIFASHIQAMHSADQHLQMCGPFFKTTVSKSQRRWLLITASCVYMSTLNSMFLILPRRSVSASTDWGCRGWRMATTVMADQAPQATLNGVANFRRMVVWYHIVAEVTGPSLRERPHCGLSSCPAAALLLLCSHTAIKKTLVCPNCT